MGFAFLTPAFLAGLAALAIPILIHLMHRERRDVVAFPSLMFLQKIPYRSVRRQKIRHWLLFLLRCVALVLLVAAFARPWLDRRSARATRSGSGARELVILVDRSYSMGYGDRWARALDAARRATDGIGPDDRATLVLFSDAAQVAAGPTADRTILRAAIDAARPGSGVTRYAPALKLAGQLLGESERPRRAVTFISDFQKVGWDAREPVRLPEGTTLDYVDLSDKVTSNVSVTTATFGRESADGRERVVASARLTNRGSERVSRRDIALEVNGRTLETKSVRLEPNSAATVTFSPFALPAGIARGTIRAGRDALPQDNVFHFVLSRGQALPVLIVESSDAGAGRSLYLSRALRIGDRPPFRVTLKKLGQLTPADLDGRSLVVLNDVAFPGGEVGRRLKEFVRAGGGLLVVLGERSAPRSWPADAADLLPAPIGPPVDRVADRGGTLGFLDRSHPVFELFRAPRSGDWASARFFRYRVLSVQGNSGVLARFDDGAVALAEKRVGKGKVLVWTSTLDNFWNDLALQPVFLP
ncbi:MAG: BatA domain-containing protein, partial [Chloroflexota bacterium]|nr:BatA domain-containing protein [Chloroflexota bacterium]